MSAQGRDNDFRILLQRLVDGELSDSERTLVADMMGTDVTLRAAYLDHCQMHALLQSEHGLLAASAPEGGDFAADVSQRGVVRRIIYAGEPGEHDPTLIVKTVAGQGIGAVDSVAPTDFAGWSAYEVEPSISAWQRADSNA